MNKIIVVFICLIFVISQSCDINQKYIPSDNILYNGIQIDENWPPRYDLPVKKSPMVVPYLESPPDVIPVNTGRQLFIDDFLIEETDLIRIFHYPDYYSENPILEPDKSWETTGQGTPYASPFSDGIWYDEQDQKFKMWYLTGGSLFYPEKQAFLTSYAESLDGKVWNKPNLSLVEGTNIVDTLWRDSNTIWLDKGEKDPEKRYKMFQVISNYRDYRWRFVLKYSNDGKHWTEGVAQSGDVYDRSTVFYNPFRSKWIWSLRNNTRLGRSRQYMEHSDPEIGTSLVHRVNGSNLDKNIVHWFTADGSEPKHPEFPDISPEIYNHDAIAYESLMLGFFSVWEGPENNICEDLKIQKRNEVCLGYSRDGFHWHRPDHKPFLGVDTKVGAWNWGNIQSIVGTPLIIGDSLYFYVSGRRLNHAMWDGYTSTGLAMLRRDGYCSMQSADTESYLLSKLLTFNGSYLFVNANVTGALCAELLDESNEVISGFSKQECVPFKGNSTKSMLTWSGRRNDLSSLKNKVVKIKFYISEGEIYSFWISPWKSGESAGFTAGGGPGLHKSGQDIPIFTSPMN